MWKALETARVSSGWAGLAEKAVLNNNTIIVHLVCRRITDSLARFRSSLARRSNSSKGKRRENIWRTDYRFSFRSFIRLAFSVDNHSVLTSKFFQLIFSPLSKTRLYLAPTKMALIWQKNFDLLISYLWKLSLPRSVVRQTISKPNKPANSVSRFIIGPGPFHAIRKLPVKTTENERNYATERFDNHHDVARYPGHQRSSSRVR